MSIITAIPDVQPVALNAVPGNADRFAMTVDFSQLRTPTSRRAVVVLVSSSTRKSVARVEFEDVVGSQTKEFSACRAEILSGVGVVVSDRGV